MSANPITRLARRWMRQLPDWASLQHPVVRYIWRKTLLQGSRWMRWLGYVLVLAMLAGLTVGTYMLYRNGELEQLTFAGEHTVFVTVYPLLALIQLTTTSVLMAQVMIVGLTPPQTPYDQTQRTWELAKVSGSGAKRVTQARWFVMFMRMSGGLVIIIIARVIFIALIVMDWLRDPALFRAALNGTHPRASDPVAIGLLALWLATLLVLPVTTTLWYLAVGTLISARPRRLWVYGVLQRVVLFAVIIPALASLLLGMGTIFLPESRRLLGWPGSGAVFSMIIFWDQGLRLLSGSVLRHAIETVDFVLWFGVPLALIATFQALTTPWLLRWAARIAGRPTKI